MGTFCINRILAFTDSIIKTDSQGQIETVCCIFKQIRINWSSINVTGISGTMITICFYIHGQ